jgi:hypothetical protein
MKIFLTILYVALCIMILFRILREFKSGYDWFSLALYLLIFLVSAGILYVTIFGLYYLFLSV